MMTHMYCSFEPRAMLSMLPGFSIFSSQSPYDVRQYDDSHFHRKWVRFRTCQVPASRTWKTQDSNPGCWISSTHFLPTLCGLSPPRSGVWEETALWASSHAQNQPAGGMWYRKSDFSNFSCFWWCCFISCDAETASLLRLNDIHTPALIKWAIGFQSMF